ncbi:50S ribosomal protein L35 [Candidatus Peregrinibacteria bacterium]|jgi:ribosomal protein L35|nr:50S ribosomal protein L35 [Candidatus Peregrinibacteria bacterium]
MAGGKQKTRKAVSKRFSKNLMHKRAAKKHRLVPKSKRSKALGKIKQASNASDRKNIRRCLHA